MKQQQRAEEVMATKVWVTLEKAYWVKDDIHTDVEGIPYLMDTGA